MMEKLNLGLSVLLLCFLALCASGENDNVTFAETFAISETKLNPYDWNYIRVNLPQYYSSASIFINTNVKLDIKSIYKHDKTKLPIICLGEGGFPLPDVTSAALKGLVLSNLSSGSNGEIQLFGSHQCYPLLKETTLKLTYGQVKPGSYYVGLFNGIGPVRTQSKMINRGSAYSFSANITVENCEQQWGQYCHQRIESASKMTTNSNGTQHFCGVTEHGDQVVGDMACKNFSRVICPKSMEMKVYSFVVEETTEDLMITATHFSYSQDPYANETGDSNARNHSVMCYVRYHAIPDKTLHDYSADISKASLVINSPMVGKWYFTIQFVYQSEMHKGKQEQITEVCHLVEWETLACPQGKAGLNCTWERHVLQAFSRKNPTVPLIYLPESANVTSQPDSFPLNPLLSKISYSDKLDYAWTYFLLNASEGVSGNNIHVQLSSDMKLNYELYVRFGGLPSSDTWDYSYSNQTSNISNSSMYKLYDTTQETINLYLLYPREGLWAIGLRHSAFLGNSSIPKTSMSVSLKSCPNRCSDHGTCMSSQDARGSTSYSYCWCDRNHGGFDCAVTLVSQAALRWHSIFLIASNAAAILPAFEALRQKACAEWVIFMSSGISSAFYHACDVGCWCALHFHVLQFMDFWLSFLAVVSTFVYLTVNSEAIKRTLFAISAIITGLLARSDAIRSRNIIIVLALGALGFLVGWLMEFCTQYKMISFRSGSLLKFCKRWKTWKARFVNFIKKMHNNFHWCFVLLGFIAFSLAATSRQMENSENYWMWHSIWHISIYTSAFFFVCSRAVTRNGDNPTIKATDSYVLTQKEDPLP